MGQGTGQRGGFSTEGLRGDRAQRAGPPERDRDLETEIEDEMRASGRGHVVPREGVVGAHGGVRRGQVGGAGVDPDQAVAEDRLYEEQEALEAAGAEAQNWTDRAGAWLNQHRRTMTFVAGAAVITAVGFMTAARMRN
jgi:hypothetical protein